MFSTKIIGVLVLIMAIGGAAFWYYFQWSQKQLRIAAENQAKLELAIEETKKAIEFQNKAIKLQTSRLNDVNKAMNTIRKESAELSKLFSNHDFANLVKQKPKLLERRQNDATDRVFDDLEKITDPETYDE